MIVDILRLGSRNRNNSEAAFAEKDKLRLVVDRVSGNDDGGIRNMFKFYLDAFRRITGPENPFLHGLHEILM